MNQVWLAYWLAPRTTYKFRVSYLAVRAYSVNIALASRPLMPGPQLVFLAYGPLSFQRLPLYLPGLVLLSMSHAVLRLLTLVRFDL